MENYTFPKKCCIIFSLYDLKRGKTQYSKKSLCLIVCKKIRVLKNMIFETIRKAIYLSVNDATNLGD